MKMVNVRLRVFILCILWVLTCQCVTAQVHADIIVKRAYYGLSCNNILKDLAIKYKLVLDYDKELLPKGIIDGRSYNNVPLSEVLEDLLKDTDLYFKVVDNRVVIRKKGTDITITPKAPVVYQRKTNFTLSGVIKDKNTGESLPFTQILIEGTKNGTTSNIDGYFTLFKVPADTSVLLVSYVGYGVNKIYLTPELVSKNIFIEMESIATKLDEVEIVGQHEELLKISDEVSVVTITPKQIASLPSLGEKDIFRSFQLLPGISGSNEASSGLYVRGGTPDQNLILFDGFTVYHVDHLFGMFSAFNADAIKDVQLSKGGFELKYGGRLSSIMEITGKDGNENKFNLGGGIGFLSVNGFTEIPLGGKGSILLTGRRSFKSFLYNKIFDKFNSSSSEKETANMPTGPGGGNMGMQEQTPKSYFYDLNGKLTIKPNKKDIFSLSVYNGEDDLDNSRDMSMSRGGGDMQGTTNDLTKWGNLGISTKWSRKWNDVFYSNALLSYSNYYSIRDRMSENTFTRNGEETTMKRGSMENNDLKDFSFKIDNEYKTGKNNQIEFGTQINKYIVDYEYTMNDTIEIQNKHDEAVLFSSFLQDKWKVFEKTNVIPGLRVSYYSLTDKIYYEPRVSLSYNITKKLKIKGATGRYYQFTNRIVRDDIESGSRDFWVLSDDDVVSVSSAIHYIAGIGYETKNFLFDIEAYYKDLKGLSEYTLRFTPSFERVNYDEYFYQGTGVAKGIDFLAQKKYGKYTGWIGYTLGQVLYNFPVYGTKSYPAGHDVTNEFKIVNSYKYNKWTFSATWIYATGKPYTAPIGGYELTLADGSTASFITVGEKNMFRLPDYNRLDVAATLDFFMGDSGKGSLSFSLFNLYNRKNIWYKEYELIEGELIETNVYYLGLTPNISLTLKLR